jgi:hypothetical protein
MIVSLYWEEPVDRGTLPLFLEEAVGETGQRAIEKVGYIIGRSDGETDSQREPRYQGQTRGEQGEGPGRQGPKRGFNPGIWASGLEAWK